jgi:transposase
MVVAGRRPTLEFIRKYCAETQCVRRWGEAMTAKRVESWVVTDDFWERVEPLIPVCTRPVDKQFIRKAGAERPPKPARQVFEAVVYVLRTGCQRKALPKERFGSVSAVHKRFLERERAGVFEAIWKAGLAEYDQMEGIAWRWQSIDGALHGSCHSRRGSSCRICRNCRAGRSSSLGRRSARQCATRAALQTLPRRGSPLPHRSSASGLRAACRLAFARTLAKASSGVPYLFMWERPAPPK